uniref:Glutamyl-tRNA(Gln) amidotransferase subunit C, mitochondrial n=1 Tax=Timema douglasi TaxID=61478 RepID=A0A7R8VTK8_TIMDO|nr:unnamed protein product [Timema douglasi]
MGRPLKNWNELDMRVLPETSRLLLRHLRVGRPVIIRCLNAKIPRYPVTTPVDESKLPPRTRIDQKTVETLERLSLVDFGNEKGIEALEDAIRFADQIHSVDTTGVEPMFSVLQDSSLHLRDDSVTDGNCRKEVLANAAVTEEEYFVAPPGNIPLTPREKLREEEELAEQL